MPVVVVLGFEVADVITCLAILLVAWAAAELLVKPLAWLLGNLPVIGDAIARALRDGAQGFENWAQDAAKNAIAALVAVVSSVVYWVGKVIDTSVQVAEGIVAGLLSSVQYIAQVANQVALGLGNLAQGLADAVAKIVATAESIPKIAAKLIAEAVDGVYKTVHGWVAGLEKAIAQAIDTAHTELGHAIDGFNTGLHQLDLALHGAISTAIDGVRTWVNDRLRPIETTLGEVKTVTDAIVSGGIITLAIETAGTLTTEIEQCIRPNCDALAPNLDLLNLLNDGALLAALAVIVGEAVKDPQAGAATVSGIVDGTVGEARGLLSAVGIAV